MPDLPRRKVQGARLRHLAFKAASLLFDVERFTVRGRREADGTFARWARSRGGQMAVQATAELA